MPVVSGRTADLVLARVVAATLEDRESRGAAERAAQRLRQPRQVPLHQLAL
jgi:hypothetical protein